LAARSLFGWLIAIASVFAGVGLTYLLRGAGLLALGPNVGGALPLQQLASGESQPLLRMAVAWLAAGAVAGTALEAFTRSRLAARTVGVALIGWALLVVAGAASDAVAVTGAIGPHLVPQLSRTGTWVATAFLSAGALAQGLAIRRPG
jgi:hypothetical protein